MNALGKYFGHWEDYICWASKKWKDLALMSLLWVMAFILAIYILGREL